MTIIFHKLLKALLAIYYFYNYLSETVSFCTNIHLDQNPAIHNKSLVENKDKSALLRAVDVGTNVKGHFDWDNHFDVLEKVLEEVEELKEAINSKTKEDAFDEMGDVLFTIAQLARHMKFSPEDSLDFSIKKHHIRYEKMLELLLKDDEDMSKMTLEKIEPYWQKSKKSQLRKNKRNFIYIFFIIPLLALKITSLEAVVKNFHSLRIYLYWPLFCI